MLESDLTSFFVFRECPHQFSDCGQKLCSVHHCRHDFNTWWFVISQINYFIEFNTYTNWLIRLTLSTFSIQITFICTADKIFQTISFIPYADFMLTRQRHDIPSLKGKIWWTWPLVINFNPSSVVSSKKNNQVNFPVSSLQLNMSLYKKHEAEKVVLIQTR